VTILSSLFARFVRKCLARAGARRPTATLALRLGLAAGVLTAFLAAGGDAGRAGATPGAEAIRIGAAESAKVPDANRQEDLPPTYALVKAEKAPVIDGVLDCGPALVPITPLDWSGPSPLPPFPAGNSATLAAAWRPDGLYVFVDVTTPAAFPADAADPVFYGAGVELFVDSDGTSVSPPTYDNPGAMQLVVAAPPDATTTGRRAEGFRNAVDEGPWAPTQFGAFPSSSGFVVEGFVAAADLGLATWAQTAGGAVGLDVAIDVSYPTAAMTGAQGHRVGQYFFHLGTSPADGGDGAAIGLPYSDPRAFCTPTLAAN
jgi:hypothetical protein